MIRPDEAGEWLSYALASLDVQPCRALENFKQRIISEALEENKPPYLS